MNSLNKHDEADAQPWLEEWLHRLRHGQEKTVLQEIAAQRAKRCRRKSTTLPITPRG